MTIRQKLRSIFPGVCTIIDGFARAVKASCVYGKEIQNIKTIASEVPINKWMLKISTHSPLSYYDAYRIVTFLMAESEAFRREPSKVTQFVIERACRGYTADVILVVLTRIDDRDMMARGMYITVKEV